MDEPKIVEVLERLVTSQGKIANAIQGLILEKDMDKEDRESVANIKIDVAVLTSKVTEWIFTSTEYRKSLYEKVDKIAETLTKLPCPERKSWYNAINRQMGVMWVFMASVVVLVITEFIKRK